MRLCAATRCLASVLLVLSLPGTVCLAASVCASAHLLCVHVWSVCSCIAHRATHTVYHSSYMRRGARYPTSLINFGSLRVGNAAFRAAFSEWVPEAWRVEAEGDIFAYVPRSMGYQHVQNGVRLLANGQLGMLDRGDVEFGALAPAEVRFFALCDHSSARWSENSLVRWLRWWGCCRLPCRFTWPHLHVCPLTRKRAGQRSCD